jgi:hypothetical protein
VLFGLSAQVEAQSRALKSSEGHTIFVIDENRQEWQGRLLRVSADALEVESDAGIRTFKLGQIRRVDADGDSVWDGALKGAATGATLGLLALAGKASGWVMISNAFSFGLLGLAIDAGCSSRHPVYHGPAVPRLGVSEGTDARAMSVSMRVRW